MKLNAGKTKNVLFTRNPNHTVPFVKLEDKLLKCVEETKLLGVILDKRMTFQSHLEAVERKASTALRSLMIAGKTEKNKSCQHDQAIQKYYCTSFGVCGICLANSRLRPA